MGSEPHAFPIFLASATMPNKAPGADGFRSPCNLLKTASRPPLPPGAFICHPRANGDLAWAWPPRPREPESVRKCDKTLTQKQEGRNDMVEPKRLRWLRERLSCFAPRGPAARRRALDRRARGSCGPAGRGGSLGLLVPARGHVTIYECRAAKEGRGPSEWAFVSSEARASSTPAEKKTRLSPHLRRPPRAGKRRRSKISSAR